MMKQPPKRVESKIYIRRLNGLEVPFVDWREHAARFPGIGRAMVRFIAGRPVSRGQMSLLRGVMLAWGAHYQVALPQTRMPRITPGILREMRGLLIAAGVDPFANMEQPTRPIGRTRRRA